MKSVTTSDLFNRPRYVRDLAKREDLVLTADGKPIAIVLGIENEDLEEIAFAIRQAKAQRALSRMRRSKSRSVVRRGVRQMRLREIEKEIRAVRRQRKPA